MKKTIAVLLAFCSFHFCWAQQSTSHISVKWAPTGLVLGSLSLQGEYNFGGRSSLTAKIGLPVNARHEFAYEADNANFNMKATSFLAGYRMYTSKRNLSGFYIEPYFKYVHQSSEGAANSNLNGRPVRMTFTNEYNGAGIGAQLGVQFLVHKRFVIDLFFLGPEINSASNKFRSAEIAHTLPWTEVEANEAKRDIEDFIDQFPFIKNRTHIVADENNRTVMADFKGALPGLRTGISFGFAF